MGITITAKNPVHTFDMGAGGFFSLRENIADALDQEFGENYAHIISCRTAEEYTANDARANDIINRKALDSLYDDVLDFLYMPDTEGSISYKTCGKIYILIKDIDFGERCFRYAAYSHNDYEEFKEFLKDCYSHRKKMRWS